MKRTACSLGAAALVLMATPVLAQQMGGAGAMPMGLMAERHGGTMERMGIPSEKREVIRVIESDYRDRLFRIGQDSYAKRAELNAIMLQPQPDSMAAKSVSREISNLQVQEADLLIEMHTRIARETGVRMPMGMGMGMGMRRMMMD